MYTRLSSRRLPSLVLQTENTWEVSPDKGSVWLKGEVVDGEYVIGPISCKTHAVHVVRNPALGPYSLEVVTPDDGVYEFKKPAKSKLAILDSLDWHYRLHFVQIDFLN